MPRKRATRAKGLGVSDVEYATMLEAQGGHCAICDATPKSRRLNVDHDHRTGAVRGLLCFTCNHYVLGKYATADKLRAAADYLDRHSPPGKATPLASDSVPVPVLRAAVVADGVPVPS
jgi:hypothetical protein